MDARKFCFEVSLYHVVFDHLKVNSRKKVIHETLINCVDHCTGRACLNTLICSINMKSRKKVTQGHLGQLRAPCRLN